MQTVCLLARELEARGFPTVALSLAPDASRVVGAPRVLDVRFPFGAPYGPPGDAASHDTVLAEALALLAGATSPGTTRDARTAWRRGPGGET